MLQQSRLRGPLLQKIRTACGTLPSRQLSSRPYPENDSLRSSKNPVFNPLWPVQPRVRKQLIRRTYAYASGPTPWQTHASAMRAVWILIGLNATMFGVWQYAISKRDNKLLRQLRENATCSWDNIKAGRYWTLVTTAFSHTGLAHFAFNMIALYAFGSIMSWVPGVGAFHIFSLSVGSAIAGSASWLWHRQEISPKSSDRRWDSFGTHTREVAYAQGASGMVMGAGAAAACLLPFAPMYLMLIPVPVPLWIVTGLYALLDVWYLDSGSRIGHAAHLGGSVFGALYYFAYLRRYGGVWQMVMRRGARR